MSLLLDALKKAAIEKKAREQKHAAQADQTDLALSDMPSLNADTSINPADTKNSIDVPLQTTVSLQNIDIDLDYLEQQQEQYIQSSKKTATEKTNSSIEQLTHSFSAEKHTQELTLEDIPQNPDASLSDSSHSADTSVISTPSITNKPEQQTTTLSQHTTEDKPATPDNTASASTIHTNNKQKKQPDEQDLLISKEALDTLLTHTQDTGKKKRYMGILSLLSFVIALSIFAVQYYQYIITRRDSFPLQKTTAWIEQVKTTIPGTLLPANPALDNKDTQPHDTEQADTLVPSKSTTAATTAKDHATAITALANSLIPTAVQQNSALMLQLTPEEKNSLHTLAHPSSTLSTTKISMIPLANAPQYLAQPLTDTPENLTYQSQIVIKKHPQQQLNQAILKAYQFFQQHDFDNAQKYYQQALQQQANNIDALHGMAAIYLQKNQLSLARQYYQQILTLYPKDILAFAQIQALTPKGSMLEKQTQITLLLKEQPQSAILFFTLGSLYAQQQQWEKAQQAFFSAWSLDNNNSDYIYNLAISLDHLQQYASASRFYQQLLLPKMYNPAINKQQLQQRIQELHRIMIHSTKTGSP